MASIDVFDASDKINIVHFCMSKFENCLKYYLMVNSGTKLALRI